MEDQNEPPSLRLHEYLALFIMLLLLATAGVLSFSSRPKKLAGAPLSIYVVGEVQEEKEVLVPQGAQIADVLAQIQITELADLDKMAHDAPVTSGQILVIPRKGALSVYVKGTLAKNEVLYFDEGATFSDLRERIKLDQKADARSLLRKKRALKDGEVVCIQFKK